VRPKFENLTVNIAGTQGTRYLKVTFNVVGKNDAANKKIDAKYAELVDTTLTILASLSMPELDEPSSKAVVRGRLVAAFNDLLKAPLVEQVFFSDFVVQ
jgi:flagellar FliL protein